MKRILTDRNISGLIQGPNIQGIEGNAIIYVKIDGVIQRTTPAKIISDVSLFEKNGDVKIGRKVEILDGRGKFLKDLKVIFSPVECIENIEKVCTYDLMLTHRRSIRVTGFQNVVIGHAYTVNKNEVYGTKSIPLKETLVGANFFVPNTSEFDGNEIGIPDWLLRLCGLWVADGCYAHDRKIIISTGNFDPIINFLRHIPRPPKHMERASEYLNEIIPWENRKKNTIRGDVKKIIDEVSCKLGLPFSTVHLAYYRPPKTNSKFIYCKLLKRGDVWLCCKELVSNMRSRGFYGLCRDKKVPEWLYTVSKRQIGIFLAGYFDGDGCIQENSIECSSVGRELIFGIKELLWRLGIPSGISIQKGRIGGFNTKNKELYTLSIGSVKGSRLFKEIVPMFKDLEKCKLSKKVFFKNKYDFSTAKALSVLENSPIEVFNIKTVSGSFIANYLLLGKK